MQPWCWGGRTSGFWMFRSLSEWCGEALVKRKPVLRLVPKNVKLDDAVLNRRDAESDVSHCLTLQFIQFIRSHPFTPFTHLHGPLVHIFWGMSWRLHADWKRHEWSLPPLPRRGVPLPRRQNSDDVTWMTWATWRSTGSTESTGVGPNLERVQTRLGTSVFTCFHILILLRLLVHSTI